MKKQIRILSLTCTIVMVACGTGAAVEESDAIDKEFKEYETNPGITKLLLEQYRQFPPTPPFNDTGTTWGGDYPSKSHALCSGAVKNAQDCANGRDATHSWDRDGRAGFSFTKLDVDGVPLIDQSASYKTTPWACVKDNVTGLVWEVKTDDGNLHDTDDEFTYYNTDPSTNGTDDGEQNEENDSCYGYKSGDPATYCNTEAYVNRVNAKGLCGANNWRMPTVSELISIQSLHQNKPTIDTVFFPNEVGKWVWSGTPSAHTIDNAWMVSFSFGGFFPTARIVDGMVRLVRDPE